jgi:hypothetical protein
MIHSLDNQGYSLRVFHKVPSLDLEAFDDERYMLKEIQLELKNAIDKY